MEKQIPTLADVDAYEVPDFLIKRVAVFHEVPEEFAAGLLKEAKRMLYLSCVSNDSISPSNRIDWAWHEMLMYTKYYQEFARFIGAYIHHTPEPPPKEKFVEETWDQIQERLGKPRKSYPNYEKTKTNYEKYFGEKPDPLYWP